MERERLRLFPGASHPTVTHDLAIRDGNGATSIRLTGSSGNITCVNLDETSDGRLKQGVAPIVNALEKITALRGVRYELKREGCPLLRRDEGSQLGFIGQEVEPVCPEVVSTDSEGYKSLNYGRLTAVLVEAVKEQQQLIREQVSALVEADAQTLPDRAHSRCAVARRIGAERARRSRAGGWSAWTGIVAGPRALASIGGGAAGAVSGDRSGPGAPGRRDWRQVACRHDRTSPPAITSESS